MPKKYTSDNVTSYEADNIIYVICLSNSNTITKKAIQDLTKLKTFKQS
jgi:hypothetical protein